GQTPPAPPQAGQIGRRAAGPHRGLERGGLAPVHAPQHDRHEQRGHLGLRELPGRIGAHGPPDLLAGQHVAVALAGDDAHRVHRRTSPAAISAGPKASGSSVPSVRASAPGPASTSSCPPPCSSSTCRHLPHGIRADPAAPVQATASSLPPPVANQLPTSTLSAQTVRPSETFSTLQPATTRPSSTRPAAPTGNPE